MKTIDERALDVIEKWEISVYKTESQLKASLQCLIIDALKEQDKLTRYACAETINECDKYYNDDLIYLNAAHNACMNSK